MTSRTNSRVSKQYDHVSAHNDRVIELNQTLERVDGWCGRLIEFDNDAPPPSDFRQSYGYQYTRIRYKLIDA